MGLFIIVIIVAQTFIDKNKTAKIILAVLAIANLFAWIVVYDLNGVRPLEVNFLDVGQGDAIFIRTPQNHKILIDGGPDNSVLRKLAENLPFYDRTLDLIILSHPEKDHMFGLLEVLKRYKVKNILWTGVVRNTPEWSQWKKEITDEKTNIEIAQAGERIILQKSNPEIFFDVLYPETNLNGKEFKDSNDTSVAVRLIDGKKSFLFAGDAGKKEEQYLEKKDIASDILKVSHHGSKYSSSEDFIKKVLPETAVIEVGKNNYGHPTAEVLATLKKFGIKVLRTDKDGDVKIISDGKIIKIINKK